MSDPHSVKATRQLTGPFRDWLSWGGRDHFEARVGPFYYRQDESGEMRSGFIVEERHLNEAGSLHGGCLLTFADFSLFVIAQPYVNVVHTVTVSLNAEFLDRAVLGDKVEITGQMLRQTRSLLFVQGVARVEQRPILSFMGLIKTVAPRAGGE